MGKINIGSNVFVYPMPDNNYWTVGAHAGKAWSDGKKLKEELT